MSNDIQKQNTTLANKPSTELDELGVHVPSNGHFEYKVVPVSDFIDGGANVSKIEELLNLYGEMGWRLSQAVVNEMGPSRYRTQEGSMAPTTQEQTLLILERWVMEG